MFSSHMTRGCRSGGCHEGVVYEDVVHEDVAREGDMEGWGLLPLVPACSIT